MKRFTTEEHVLSLDFLLFTFDLWLFSDRAKYRARGAHEQIIGGSEDTEDTAFDALEEVRRGDDGVQSDPDRLQRAV